MTSSIMRYHVICIGISSETHHREDGIQTALVLLLCLIIMALSCRIDECQATFNQDMRICVILFCGYGRATSTECGRYRMIPQRISMKAMCVSQRLFNTSSAQRSSSVNVSAMHANRYMNQKRHYPRRPVTIIRRAVPNKNNKRMNPMMRASSAMFTPTNRHSFSPNQNPYTHNKIGLFDGDSLMTSQLGATPRFRADVKDSVGSGWDFLERSLLFGIQIQITHGIGDII
eukprot:94509_1